MSVLVNTCISYEMAMLEYICLQLHYVVSVLLLLQMYEFMENWEFLWFFIPLYGQLVDKGMILPSCPFINTFPGGITKE